MAVKSLAQSSVRQTPAVNSLLTGYSGNDFHHLETVKLGANASEVVFSNLQQYSVDYDHLQLWWNCKGTSGSNQAILFAQFNGDTTQTNYWRHIILAEGGGRGVYSYQGVAASLGYTSAATLFAQGIAEITDAFSTTKTKSVRSISGGDATYIHFHNSVWNSTASITSIRLFPESASFAAGSDFYLYGVK
jgi:hypothetical protein